MRKRGYGERKRKVRKEKKKGKRKRREKIKRKGVEGRLRETEKKERVVAKRQGLRTEKAKESPRVWRLCGLWAGLGYSLASQILLFSFAN